LLWRRRPQRLESEILRDTVLAVSGTLNTDQFGPAFKPPIAPEAIVARNTKNPYPKDARDTPETRRRTVYMFHKRVTQNPLMQVSHGPGAPASRARPNSPPGAPQALARPTDPSLRDRAPAFARRLLMSPDVKPADAVERGFRLALSRPPTDDERDASVQ